MVGALHDDVESLDASGGYISLRGHLGFTAFEIESDQNLKLVVQRTSPLMHGRDAATGNHHSPNVIQVTAKRPNVSELPLSALFPLSCTAAWANESEPEKPRRRLGELVQKGFGKLTQPPYRADRGN
jgi:hypothetical protein